MKRVIAVLLIIFILTGCNSNKLTYEDFKKKLGNDWEFSELPIQDDVKENIEKMSYANNYSFLIFYYDLKTEKDANEMYDYNVEQLDNNKGSACVNKSESHISYKKYISICNGEYNLVLKNKDIMLTVSADEENKKEIEAAIKKLGY